MSDITGAKVVEQIIEGNDLVTYERTDVLDPTAPKIEVDRQPLPTETVNRREIETLARAAMAANRAFLGTASPTAAQNAAQFKALTRQVNRLMRLALNEMDGTD